MPARIGMRLAADGGVRDGGVRDGGVHGIAAALIEIAMPDGLEVAAIARLRAPLGFAVAAAALGALLALLAIVDIARLLVGPTAVAVVLSLALLLLPAAKLALGMPSGPMVAIVHAAPLLRAIELGDSLGRAWRAAALLSTIGPAVVVGAACAAVLIARGALPAGAGVAAAATSGALAAWIVADRDAQMLRAGGLWRAVPWRSLAQAGLAVTVALAAAAAAPLLDARTSAVLGPASLAVSLAIAVHLAGELLGLDARGRWGSHDP